MVYSDYFSRRVAGYMLRYKGTSVQHRSARIEVCLAGSHCSAAEEKEKEKAAYVAKEFKPVAFRKRIIMN